MTSSQPRKQRKSRYQAPLHRRHKLMGAMLSPKLREEHGMKSIPLRMGDTVKVLRGDHKGKEGKVAGVNLKKMTITVDGVSVTKADGTEVPRPVQPSKVMITKLSIKDEKRLGD
ncbi:MAG: 50S ribosomal protein L24 [Euryarchaeota archaeon]|nr:50S ribosomal protein L24 [Euryarchaeota archaeon]MBU4491623.1 50S ribosomal protein L24 [Euryarchaeota archaeon]MCG2727717.1 50S ribosomal protein L24 [Candidatus Methanoperedenaceae archaeon]